MRYLPAAAKDAGSDRSRSRAGVILYLVVFMLIVLSVFAVSFQQVARQGQAVVFRFEQSEACRQLVYAAIEEAEGYLQRESGKTGSTLAAWLMDSQGRAIPIPTPLTAANAARLVRGDLEPQVAVEARTLDWRQVDSKGNRYFGREGLGTIELRGSATAWRRGDRVRIAACELTRHHDYKVAAILSSTNNTQPRSAYAQSWPLDYVLLVRNGLKEFNDNAGYCLNNSRRRLEISQNGLQPAQMGKIYFGSADGTATDRVVFLNVPDKFKQIIPAFPLQTVKTMTTAEVLALLPSFKAEVDSKLQGSGITAEQALQGMEGIFRAANLPIDKPDTYGTLKETAQATLNQLLQQASRNCEKNPEPMLELLSTDAGFAANPANVDGVLEGAIRQRFLYLSFFNLDFSKVQGIDDQTRQEMQRDFRDVPCLPQAPPIPNDAEEIARKMLQDFYQNLPNLANQDPKLMSRLDADFLLKGGLNPAQRLQPPSFPQPRFFDKSGNSINAAATGKTGMQAWSHVNLWSRRLWQASELEAYGIHDRARGILRISGIIQIDDDVELAANGQSLQVEGQGVIIGKGFKIGGAIRKRTNDDLLVLMARNNIEISGGQQVDAHLIALGNPATGMVKCTGKLDLFGGMVVEWLDPDSNLTAGQDHRIRYDPLLKSMRDVYVLTVSPAITFQRLVEPDS